MPEQSEPTEAQRDQAALWLARRAGRSMSEEDERVFAEWIACDPNHLKAYEDVAGLWARLGTPAQRLAADAGAGSNNGARGQLGQAGLRVLPFAVVIALLVVVSASLLWLMRSDADVVTARGEHSVLKLPDGSHVDIGPDSALDLDFAGRRGVRLRRGEAYFEIDPGRAEPFMVDLDEASVTVTGTKFNIDRLDTQAVVTVLEGTVVVKDRQARSVRVDRGQRAIVKGGLVGAAHLSDADAAIAWLSRRLVFDNASLADAVSAFRRRAKGRVLLVGNHDKRVSGTFPADDVENSLDTIALATGTRIMRLTPWVTILY